MVQKSFLDTKKILVLFYLLGGGGGGGVKQHMEMCCI